MTNKKIDWLEQFAMDYQDKLQKTASLNREADQIIVDCSAYPNAKVDSLVDHNGHKYKVISTEYKDKSGPGILLEKLADSNFGTDDPTADAVISNGEVKVTAIEDDNTANCGDSFQKVAATASGEMVEVELPEVSDSEYPPIIPTPGGVKPIPSAPIEQEKRVTDAPYHPTYDPGNKYALDVEEDYQTAADRTANIIAQEDAQDRTTVEGYFTWNKNIILDKIVDDAKSEAVDEDDLAAFDDSKDAIEMPDNDLDIDEADMPDEEDDLAAFNDSESNTDDMDDIDTDMIDEDIPEESDEELDAVADTLVNDDNDEDLPDLEDNFDGDLDDATVDDIPDTEEELPDVEDYKDKKEASADTNRIISRLAELI